MNTRGTCTHWRAGDVLVSKDILPLQIFVQQCLVYDQFKKQKRAVQQRVTTRAAQQRALVDTS